MSEKKLEIEDGEYRYIDGHKIHREGDVYSCNCPAWMFQRVPITQRTCKHLKILRGENAEENRVLMTNLKRREKV